MRFSVITVTYNSRKFLTETIESVLSQDYDDFEYIIVDGGSTDGTLGMIKDFAEGNDRIRWISEPDNGISDAFNKGLALASGDVIGILNSDDTYASGALAIIAQAYLLNPGADVFHGDMIRFQGEVPLFLLKPGKIGENIWCEMPLNHPATFVTRRAYTLVGGFDVGLQVAMDYELVLRLYRSGCHFQYIGRVLANMRYGGASDERFFAARREVLTVTIAAGYPRWRAVCWFVVKVGMNIAKNMLRTLGLHGLIRLHPKFKKYQEES